MTTQDQQHKLAAPRGITVEEAAAALHLSPETVRRLCRSGELPAWKPFKRSSKWIVDEVALARIQGAKVAEARRECVELQEVLIQGHLNL